MRIRFRIILLAVIVFGLMGKTRAQDYRLALGVRMSNASPTISNSVSLKYGLPNQVAVEGLVSYGSRFGVGTLVEKHKGIGRSGIYWFYGGGVFVGFEEKVTFTGPTGILGLDYKFKGIPLNLSLDVKPELNVMPKLEFVGDAFSFTARFTFK